MAQSNENESNGNEIERPILSDAAWAYATLAMRTTRAWGLPTDVLFDALMLGRVNPAFEASQRQCCGRVLATAADTTEALRHLVVTLPDEEWQEGSSAARVSIAAVSSEHLVPVQCFRSAQAAVLPFAARRQRPPVQ